MLGILCLCAVLDCRAAFKQTDISSASRYYLKLDSALEDFGHLITG